MGDERNPTLRQRIWFEIVELLQHEMTRVVENFAAWVARDALQEHLETGTVMQILAGMDFEAEVHARSIECIEYRPPARGERVERGLDQTRRALRPGIDIRPGERAGKSRMRRQTKTGGGACRLHQLIDGPGLPCHGSPRTKAGANPSKASSYAGCTATSCPCRWVESSVSWTSAAASVALTSSQYASLSAARSRSKSR